MTAIASAWQEFSNALAEAQKLHAAGAGAEILQGVLQRAQELLQAVDAKLGADSSDLPAEVRSALDQLRANLAELEGTPPVRH